MARTGDHSYRPGTPGHRQPEETRRKISETLKRKWQDPEYRARQTKALGDNLIHAREDPEVCSARMKKQWSDPAWRNRMRERQSIGAQRRWADPEKRAALLRARGISVEGDHNED